MIKMRKINLRREGSRSLAIAFGEIEFFGLSIKVEIREKKDGGLFVKLPELSYKMGNEWINKPLVIPKDKEVYKSIADEVMRCYEKEISGVNQNCYNAEFKK